METNSDRTPRRVSPEDMCRAPDIILPFLDEGISIRFMGNSYRSRIFLLSIVETQAVTRKYPLWIPIGHVCTIARKWPGARKKKRRTSFDTVSALQSA